MGSKVRPVRWGYAKIILVMAKTPPQKKGVKIKTQKQSYEVLVHKERLM
jgi:hypothetical protein